MKKNTTTASAKAKAPERTPIDLPIEQLMIAPWNPRGEITTDSVSDLVPSIKSKGLIQRIAVVRAPKEKDKYIVCAGNRRLVACQLAGMKSIPAELFECSEKEARQMTLLENLKRKDAEPIYVAELIKTLREKDGLSAEEIAAEIGCEVSYVIRRAKLIDLAPEWKEAAQQRTLNVTTDLLEKASRYTQDIQKDAYDDILRNYSTERRLSWNDVAREFESRTCDLEKATFPRKKCAICPNNTACTPTLWDDPQGAKFGRCLDKRCFDLKKSEAEANEVSKLEKDGTKVVRVKDYYSVPEDHRTAPEGKYKVACVFNDFNGRQKILYVQKDPTEFTDEKKSVNTQNKERAKLIKETEKKIKDWESENVHDVLENRTWNLDDAHFAAVVFAVAASYGYINANNFYAVDSGLRNLARMVWRNDYDNLERKRYIDELSRMIIDDDGSHLKTLAVFEESNYDIDPEMKKLLRTR